MKTEIRGAPRGPLTGRNVVIKDNVCLAGVPMMNGASTLKGYTPDIDATIVTRLLDAGATIIGKAHCEYFCLSGGSHTNATGPVHNPHRMAIRPAAPPPDPVPWSGVALWKWPSAATRVARSGCRPPFAAATA